MSPDKSKEEFREHLANQTREGKRSWIYPKIIKGKYTRYRTYVSWFLLAFFFVTPFIKINGYPMLLLNVFERRFVIFGKPFWPQDFYIFVLFALTGIVFIVVFTVIYGRVWCGWACPQTIFMEMVFRKVENLVEGNANKQKKLDAMPWNAEKIFRKSLKHSIFFGISFIIAHTFLAYMIGYEALWNKIAGPFSENYLTFLGLLIFSLVFYLVFAKLRELVCIMICPYGRLQGVMLDGNSMVVSYDYERGEPRGKIRKGEDQTTKGDCVDCGLCVDVCPTGIDIRNGTQLECINCTACMDACDSVMEKVNKPLGLIRIDSNNNIKNKVGFRFTPRVISYTAVMIMLLSLSTTLVLTRSSIDANMLRIPGKTYTETAEGTIQNLYNLTMVNKTYEKQELRLTLDNPNANLIVIGDQLILEPDSDVKKIIIIEMDKSKVQQSVTRMNLHLYQGEELMRSFEIRFLAPLE